MVILTPSYSFYHFMSNYFFLCFQALRFHICFKLSKKLLKESESSAKWNASTEQDFLQTYQKLHQITDTWAVVAKEMRTLIKVPIADDEKGCVVHRWDKLASAIVPQMLKFLNIVVGKFWMGVPAKEQASVSIKVNFP